MLYQISSLIILGCFCPAVLSRPSVSLQNDGNGHYDFQYDVSHPKGNSRGHMRFGATHYKHAGSQIQESSSRKNQADDYAARLTLSSAHNPDGYHAEKLTRRPHDYPNSPQESEILYEPRPSYPSPYDSATKPLGDHNGAHDEVYNSPVSKVNHQSPVHSASIPEANYYPHPPQPIHDTNGPGLVEQHGSPNNFVGSDPVLSQEPISQVSEPVFNEPRESYSPNHGDSLNVHAVPVGPNYQFIPSGPPYVVDSHTTEIIHPPLPKDPTYVQQPVDLVPHSQEVLPSEPSLGLPPKTEVVQPALSHAFQLPVAPSFDHSPILSGRKVEDVQQATHDDEIVPPPYNPILTKESVDLVLHADQPISHDSNLTPLSGDLSPPPVSHAFRLPLLPIASEHSPIQAGNNVEAIHSIAHLEQSAGIAPIDPISHSTRLLIPGSATIETSGAPKDLSDSFPSLGHDSANLGPQNSMAELLKSTSDFSDFDTPVDSHVLPPTSHAFRLSLPVSNQPSSSVSELKSVEGPSPFSEVESPESPQLPQLSHAFRLNLPSGNAPVLNVPKVEYFPN